METRVWTTCKIGEQALQGINNPRPIATMVTLVNNNNKNDDRVGSQNNACKLYLEARFPYSTQRGVAKFVLSAQLNPKRKRKS